MRFLARLASSFLLAFGLLAAPALAGPSYYSPYASTSAVVCSTDAICKTILNVSVGAQQYAWKTSCAGTGTFTPAGTHTGCFAPVGGPGLVVPGTTGSTTPTLAVDTTAGDHIDRFKLTGRAQINSDAPFGDYDYNGTLQINHKQGGAGIPPSLSFTDATVPGSLTGWTLCGSLGEMCLVAGASSGNYNTALSFGWDDSTTGVSLIQGYGTDRLSIQSVAAITHISNTSRFEWEGSFSATFLSFVGYQEASANGAPINFNNSGQTPTPALAAFVSNYQSAVPDIFQLVDHTSGSDVLRIDYLNGGTAAQTLAANVSANTITGYSVTGSGTTPGISLSGTWNTSGSPTGIFENITNTASGASAALIDLQVGSTSKFTVTPAGVLKLNGAQIACANLSNAGAFCSGTDAANLTGTVAPARLSGAYTGITGLGTIAGLTVTGSFTATGLVTNADLVNTATTVNGVTCTLGSTCTITASAGTITVASTTIASGATTRVLYDNAGSLGEYTVSGSGNVCMTTSCSMTTPALGTPSALVLTNATGLPLSGLVTQAADTIVMNASGSSAAPTAVSIPNCTAATCALQYNTSTHAWGTNTAINAATLGGATFAAPGAIGSTTRSTGAFTSLTTTQVATFGDSTHIGSPVTVWGDGGGTPVRVVINDANASGYNWDIANAASAFGSLYFRYGTNPGAAPTNWALVLSKIGLVSIPQISTDATHTDSSVCQDTTTHGLYFGSGTLGVCLGTSSLRYKQDIQPMAASLGGLRLLKLETFRYRKGHGDNGMRRQNGLMAEDVAKIWPDCVVNDAHGKPNSVDFGCVFYRGLKAEQELSAANDNLERRVAAIERRIRR